MLTGGIFLENKSCNEHMCVSYETFALCKDFSERRGSNIFFIKISCCPSLIFVTFRKNQAKHAAAGIGVQGSRGVRDPGGPGATIQCIDRATLPSGINDGERGKQDDKLGKGGNKTTEKFLAKPVPRAAAACGRQLKMIPTTGYTF